MTSSSMFNARRMNSLAGCRGEGEREGEGEDTTGYAAPPPTPPLPPPRHHHQSVTCQSIDFALLAADVSLPRSPSRRSPCAL